MRIMLSMTSKERILTAMRGGIPDTVPVQMGISEMVPAKYSGLPFWDFYLYKKAPHWKYMVECIELLGFDGYLYYYVKQKRSARNPVTSSSQTVRQDDEYIVVRTAHATPDGDLWEEQTYPKYDCPTVTRGLVKNRRDFEIYIKYWFPLDSDYDVSQYAERKQGIGDLGTVAAAVSLPGMHHLTNIFDGRLEKATYFAYDNPDLMEEYRERFEAYLIREMTQILDTKPDYVQIGASGLLTLSNPRLFRKYSLPTLQKLTRMCRQAGILSELHSCGRERLIVETCVNETDLDSINPLQPPPMGDCDLAELKREFGHRICLKGNVGVTEPLLFGTLEDVERDVVRCMEAAKAGGRYILFSEEQLGRDTPWENMRHMVAMGRKYGKY